MHIDDVTTCHRCGRPSILGYPDDERFCSPDCEREARRAQALANYGFLLCHDPERAGELLQEWSRDADFVQLAEVSRELRDALLTKGGAA